MYQELFNQHYYESQRDSDSVEYYLVVLENFTY